MVVTLKEEKNTLEYQDTMSVDIKNIASKKQPFWWATYEVIENSYIEEIKLFPTIFLNQSKQFPNDPQHIQNEIKPALKNGYGTGVLFTSDYDPLNGFIW